MGFSSSLGKYKVAGIGIQIEEGLTTKGRAKIGCPTAFRICPTQSRQAAKKNGYGIETTEVAEDPEKKKRLLERQRRGPISAQRCTAATKGKMIFLFMQRRRRVPKSAPGKRNAVGGEAPPGVKD
jgi:hypothetical protein